MAITPPSQEARIVGKQEAGSKSFLPPALFKLV
jgi:hypothetical protein